MSLSGSRFALKKTAAAPIGIVPSELIGGACESLWEGLVPLNRRRRAF